MAAGDGRVQSGSTMTTEREALFYASHAGCCAPLANNVIRISRRNERDTTYERRPLLLRMLLLADDAIVPHH